MPWEWLFAKPATASWFQLLTAALGGGFVVKILDIIYQEIRRHSERSTSAKQIVEKNLDPLLKAADELSGKLRSLAESDFKELYEVDHRAPVLKNQDFSSLTFLFGRFWARIEILKRESISFSIVRDRRGRQLQSFLDCLESTGVRVVDRIAQRAVGELMIRDGDDRSNTISFVTFVKKFEEEAEAKRWLEPLMSILARMRHTAERQMILKYCTVVHAMLDTLDKGGAASKRRPSVSNKLSKKTWRELKYRVFGRYLPFVKDPQRYFGPPPKKGRPKREGSTKGLWLIP